MTKTINLEECDVAVREFVQSLKETTPILLFEDGQARYVFGEIDDFDWEVFSLSQNQSFMDYLDEIRQRSKREGTIPLAEVRRQLGVSQNG